MEIPWIMFTSSLLRTNREIGYRGVGVSCLSEPSTCVGKHTFWPYRFLGPSIYLLLGSALGLEAWVGGLTQARATGSSPKP